MKTTYLKEFLIASESANMVEAASKLSIAPSVLSKHLKVIEQELDIILFKNTKKNTLTTYGEILVEYAREITKLESEFFSNSPKLLGESYQTIKVGMSPMQTKELTRKVIEPFCEKNPNIKIEIVETQNLDMLKTLKQKQCDFVFYRNQGYNYRDPNISIISLFQSDAICYIASNHPLANKASISLEDLAKEKIYLRNEHSLIYKLFKELFAEKGLSFNVEISSEHSIYDNVKNGDGMTLYLSEPVKTQYNENIKIIPIEPKITTFIDVLFLTAPLNSVKSLFIEYVFNIFINSLK